MALKTREVQLSENYMPMMWVLPELTIADLVEEFEYLKENFGLTQSRLGYSIGLGEATISRIFRGAQHPNKSTLHNIYLGLTEWKDFFENYQEEDE
jgi:predicted transcriptional regulator|tara:strand:- start:152 stop:439 length:288 start_codon:yes stop_codon:yes gene_type:complete